MYSLRISFLGEGYRAQAEEGYSWEGRPPVKSRPAHFSPWDGFVFCLLDFLANFLGNTSVALSLSKAQEGTSKAWYTHSCLHVVRVGIVSCSLGVQRRRSHICPCDMTHVISPVSQNVVPCISSFLPSNFGPFCCRNLFC